MATQIDNRLPEYSGTGNLGNAVLFVKNYRHPLLVKALAIFEEKGRFLLFPLKFSEQ